MARWYDSLRRSGEFSFVRQRGRRLSLPTMRAFYARRRSGPVRVGIAVPKTVGNAVVRNRVRRRIQGALDSLAAGAAPASSGDFVFSARPEAAAACYAALAADVRAAVARLGVPKPP